jgi:hypothetical protein
MYSKRAGIEGTISQGVRTLGLRCTRYLGLIKTHLGHVFTNSLRSQPMQHSLPQQVRFGPAVAQALDQLHSTVLTLAQAKEEARWTGTPWRNSQWAKRR